MKTISLDASGWQSPDDFYSALLPALGAPAWHGRNLNALDESLGEAGINEVRPPYVVEVTGTAGLSSHMSEFLAEVAKVFEDAQRESRGQVSLLMS